MTIQSYRASVIKQLNYRFFAADFFELERFDPDDFELVFDALDDLVRFCAVDADFVFDADFEAPDFFIAPVRCLRSFSDCICSPRVSISSLLSTLLAFLKSSFSSS